RPQPRARRAQPRRAAASRLREDLPAAQPARRRGRLRPRLPAGGRLLHHPRPARRPRRDHARDDDRHDGQHAAQLGLRRDARGRSPGGGRHHFRRLQPPSRPSPAGQRRRGSRTMSDDRLTPVRVALWVFSVALLVFTSFNNSPYLEFPPRALSLRWYRNFFSSAHWIDPALLSLRVALVTMVGATLLGTFAAIGLARGRFSGKRGLELFLVSPMVVPVVVMALGLYFLFSPLHLLGTPAALYLGHTVIATPLVLVIVLAGLRTTDPATELAA